MSSLINMPSLQTVTEVGNTTTKQISINDPVGGETALILNATSSAGSGPVQSWSVDGVVNLTYGLFLGTFTGFAQPNLAGTIFFGMADASAYILISSGAITISGTITAGPITTTNLTDSALTAGGIVVIGAAGLLTYDADITFATDTLTVTKALVKAGSSSSTVKVGGTLKVDTTKVGNVGTGEDDLITYSVPASTLGTNGDYIEFDMGGIFAANANVKRVRIKFGATTIFDTGALGFNATDWRAHGKIIRTGAATQKAICTFDTNTATLRNFADYTTPAETLSGAITLKATGEATSNDDITQELLVVESFLGA